MSNRSIDRYRRVKINGQRRLWFARVHPDQSCAPKLTKAAARRLRGERPWIDPPYRAGQYVDVFVPSTLNGPRCPVTGFRTVHEDDVRPLSKRERNVVEGWAR